jgi:hypothetical protein
MNVKEFLKDRKEALLSVDKCVIKAYMKKYGVADTCTSEEAFWYGMWKALKFVTDINDVEKAATLKKIEKKMEECK